MRLFPILEDEFGELDDDHRQFVASPGTRRRSGFSRASRTGRSDDNYTRGDRLLAWSVFLYSFGWGFCLCFLGNVAWHVLGERGILPPQPASWWGHYFFLVNICVACAVGLVSTFWFGICSTRDLVRLFRDLEARERAGGGADAADDGRVAGES